MKAELVAENLVQYCPTTNLYRGDDGRFFLVTVASADALGRLARSHGIPVIAAHLPTAADVFLATEDGMVVDADGNPANGMTPLEKVADCANHAQALAAMGYELVVSDPTNGLTPLLRLPAGTTHEQALDALGD